MSEDKWFATWPIVKHRLAMVIPCLAVVAGLIALEAMVSPLFAYPAIIAVLATCLTMANTR